MEQVKNVTEVLRHVEKNTSNPKAFSSLVNNEWTSVSTEQFLNEIRYLTLALNQLGLKKGEMVGILAQPSPRWTIADYAIMTAGGVTVPLFANISEENFVFEVTQTDQKILFVEGVEQWAMYNRNKHLFQTVISFEDEPNPNATYSYRDLIKKGKEIDKAQPNLFTNLQNQIKNDDLATIIYTSGSTGVPKGVVLTHLNHFSNLHLDPLGWGTGKEHYLSILPLAHTFGRSLNNLMIVRGNTISYSHDLKNLGTICQQLHPSIVVVVPRLLEKIYAKMLAKVQNAGLLKRAIGQWAFDLANDENDDSLYKHLLHPIADKIVYSALRNALGGNLKIVITGGAALNPHLNHFFVDIGVPLYEGWGLTEAAVASVNSPEHRKIGTVGQILPTLQLKISPEGEGLLKGDVVMSGYYKNPEATAQALDKDGWLHTGDKLSVDQDGFVTIIGRLREIYKTSTGEMIVPIPIEQALCKAPLIDMAMVIGEGRKFASALLFPNAEVLESLKKNQNQTQLSDEEFLKSDFIRKEMDQVIHSINQHLNHWEQIHKYSFISTPLTVESGELTPSMKIRRDIVAKKYEREINEMYNG
jgi:long-chain acyl-CoA synthetase